MNRFDYSAPNQIRFQRADPRLIQQAGTSAGSVAAGDILGKIAQTDLLAREEAARQQAQANADRTYAMQKASADREQAKYDTQLQREKALTGIATGFTPYAEASGAQSTPTMDKAVLDALGKEEKIANPLLAEYETATPKRKQQIDAQLNKLTFFGSGGKALDNTTALQNLYERRNMMSKEEATKNVMKNAIGRGVLPADAAALATSLSAGLMSDADRLAAAEKEAEVINKRNELLFKEDSATFRKGIGSGGASYTGTKGANEVIKAINGVSVDQWIGGDRADALDSVESASAHLKGPGKFTDKEVGSILSNAITYASGATDWTNDQIEFDSDRFAEYVNKAQNNPALYKSTAYGGTGGNRYTGGKPSLAAETTAGDILAKRAIAREKGYGTELDRILGRSANARKGNIGVRTGSGIQGNETSVEADKKTLEALNEQNAKDIKNTIFRKDGAVDIANTSAAEELGISEGIVKEFTDKYDKLSKDPNATPSKVRGALVEKYGAKWTGFLVDALGAVMELGGKGMTALINDDRARNNQFTAPTGDEILRKIGRLVKNADFMGEDRRTPRSTIITDKNFEGPSQRRF